MRVGEHFCPGVFHAVQAKDGLLIRIRVPGGLIEPNQLRAVADLSHSFAGETIEITSRANLQLRAIRNQDLDQVIESISLAGLLPSPQHDRVRNIVTSPIAGLDTEELFDPRPLVHELDRQLRAEPAFANLHPKFSFAIHGGPRRFRRDLDDISLEAASFDDSPHFYLSIGGTSSGFVVKRANAVECILAAAKMCIELALESGAPVRAKAIATISGTLEHITGALSHLLMASPVEPPSPIVNEALIGIYPTAQGGDRRSIVPSVPLGRLTPGQARYLADAANEWEGDLRLAPWRGIVLGSIPKSAVNKIVDHLHTIGLSCEGRDGFQGIAACAGNNGCEASLADVRGDAASLARRLLGHAAPSGWTVNLSGCEKQCARRHGATAELVAGPLGYTLNIEGRRVASDCSREFALDVVAALHENLLSEVAAR
ncbi:precorrin-3B synthase [Edaphobacter modestus]|uniref:Ferredoxin-nitrite reductase/precorrin-3B synthase n=1 Tax=Edaphobacter modestus TaxID=388466 RepID=A0A4Q7YR40_9BACT|nr:precorrin-3B synthase [Edaphobacter modestus]RZU40147.1 ferredoxin-nitrite reductase/precorrin-3B synthase [Edaphobacter modestus]